MKAGSRPITAAERPAHLKPLLVDIFSLQMEVLALIGSCVQEEQRDEAEEVKKTTLEEMVYFWPSKQKKN